MYLKERILRATIQTKSVVGFEYCVCWLTNGHPPKLLVSNIPHNSGIVETVINQITTVCFPNLEFEIKEIEIGKTIALVFTPV